MLSRTEIVEILNNMTTEKNKGRIEELLGKLERTSDEDLEKLLTERKVKSARDVKKMVKETKKKIRRIKGKFKNLNDIVSFGATDSTIHIHLIPKDAHDLLTREGMKKAELALIDALEKIKGKLGKEKKYKKIQQVYAVSPIMTGIVSRWFKDLGFDVKTLPMEQAKEDEELYKFAGRFEGAKKLGRANLTKEQLMSEEWEERKETVKTKLLTPRDKGIVENLQTMTNTDHEIVQATEAIEARVPETRETKPEVRE